MKYIFSLTLFFLAVVKGFTQGQLPQTFFEGKSVVMISSDPGARPVLSWKELADSIHPYLVEAGADPVGYFELEQVVLSEARQAAFAGAFNQRKVQNIILVTRQKQKVSIHVGPYTGNSTLIPSTALFGVAGSDWNEAGGLIAELGKSNKSQNLLVIDVAEFPQISSQETAQAVQRFLPRNPLNLEVFKLGIPLEGSSAETGFMSYFRYDILGKTQEAVLAEQANQKIQLEAILSRDYPHQIEWLTEAKTNQELIQQRIQFVLVKVEGRQADLMASMGLEPITGEAGAQTVVKYYIRFLVRDELYLGPAWDADPDWQVALSNFLENLKKPN